MCDDPNCLAERCMVARMNATVDYVQALFTQQQGSARLLTRKERLSLTIQKVGKLCG